MHADAIFTEEKQLATIAFGTVASSPNVVYPIKRLPKRKRPSMAAASSDARAPDNIRALTPIPPSEPPPNRGETCMCCGGRGKVESRDETWVTHSEDPNVWASVLDELGADVGSQQELFNLATAGPSYRVAAGSIIHKVMKKSAYGELGNVSAFIAASVKMAWHKR